MKSRSPATVEADETYIGAKKYDKRRKRARYDKVPVFGVVTRGGRQRRSMFPPSIASM
jgi:hypothetical protein